MLIDIDQKAVELARVGWALSPVWVELILNHINLYFIRLIKWLRIKIN
ncbi:Uncharacterised protein [Legionella cincinnatiensis]|uniref:Uncharacterized protein n=1 Tax=Legionella cincinnatiensis TaxID=28085 RepID=A0A378IU06_9GAMM|nr:Uncharacterised protein [Legionella cincinnatiensis]